MAENDVRTEQFTLPSTDGTSTCVGTLWMPQGAQAHALVQISHGMCEHIGCYDRSARDLVARGYVVYGIDHIGHGRTQPDPALRGVFDPVSGNDHIIEDQHAVRLLMAERFPGLPLVLLGHSMGSFVARCYIQRHGEGLAGAIIMGTGWMDGGTIGALNTVTGLIARLKGWSYRSKLIDGMGAGGYNKAFEGTGAKTGYEWLSRDEAKAIAYRDDPDCGWMFSVSGYRMLANLLRECSDPKRIAGVPKDLPIMVISGSKDPVGADGVGPAKVFRALKDAGVRTARSRSSPRRATRS
ncbi:MAG: alpha/beta fold hydrolase [Atopobiaceae bacterium]|nr:alpha/beta fold hydrolase [Atopobiaceae bacterium]